MPMEKRMPEPSDDSIITDCLQDLLKGETCLAVFDEQKFKSHERIANVQLL